MWKNSFFGILKVTDDFGKDRIRIRYSEVWFRGPDPDPYQNVTDPEHCNEYTVYMKLEKRF